MNNVFSQLPTPAQLQWEQDTPVAAQYDDAYFTRHQGPAETRYVFIEGNRLIQRFQQLPENGFFVVGETGFGTGLNFLATAQAFLQHAPAQARLHFISTEKHPMPLPDLQRAQAFWPELSELAEELQAHYPAPTPGFHRRWLANHRIALTLVFADVEEGLRALAGQVDAWFLDGFAPAKNPEMWQQSLFDLLAQRSAPGASLATFTAAGFVRRGLEASGFHIRKRKGFGTKRHMSLGQFNGPWRPQRYPLGAVAVAGAGLAGATCARHLAELGHQVHVYDPKGVAQAASGNLAGLLYATPSAVGTAQNLFYQHSYLQTLHWLERYDFPQQPQDGALTGVHYALVHPRQREKILNAVGSPYWPEALLKRTGEAQVMLPQSGYIQPAAWCQHLLSHPNIQLHTEAVLPEHYQNGLWRLPHGHVQTLILANSFGAQAFVQQALPLRAQRGQVSYVAATEESTHWREAWCHRGYVTPSINGLHCVGATFDRGHDPEAARSQDDLRNLEALAEHLPNHWRALGGENSKVQANRVGVRCQLPDYLPLAGALSPHLFISVGHGSRGLTHTPLCAEIVAAQLTGEPQATGTYALEVVNPLRFTKNE